MTEAEREILEERLAIAVEHLKPETAQRIFDAVVSELESFEVASSSELLTAHGSPLTKDKI